MSTDAPTTNEVLDLAYIDVMIQHGGFAIGVAFDRTDAWDPAGSYYRYVIFDPQSREIVEQGTDLRCPTHWHPHKVLQSLLGFIEDQLDGGNKRLDSVEAYPSLFKALIEMHYEYERDQT